MSTELSFIIPMLLLLPLAIGDLYIQSKQGELIASFGDKFTREEGVAFSYQIPWLMRKPWVIKFSDEIKLDV